MENECRKVKEGEDNPDVSGFIKLDWLHQKVVQFIVSNNEFGQ